MTSQREVVKLKISKQEENNRKLKEILKIKKNGLELQQSEYERNDNEDINKMDTKIKENEKLIVEFKQRYTREVEYSCTIGYLVSKTLKVDYKKNPGSCLCLEGKVCASSTGAEIECNLWNCPLVSTSVNEVETENSQTTIMSTLLCNTIKQLNN